MPIEVDEAQRLDAIAEASIRVARERGVRAITVRAVAEQLGGSTSVVTNYVPNRSALLINAMRRAQKEWGDDAERALAGLEGVERLRGFARWMCTTTPDDDVIRRLLMEILSGKPGADPEVEAELRELARDHYAEILAMVTDAGVADPGPIADALHLMFRGYWLSALEDPERWPAESGTRVVMNALDGWLA